MGNSKSAATILDVAQRLFGEDGYDATTVSRIAVEAGISEAIFYDHFESRDELIRSIFGRMTEEIVAEIVPLLTDSAVSPVDRLNEFFGSLNSWKTARREELMAYVEAFQRDESLQLQAGMKERSRAALVPYVAVVIEEGVELGVFSTAFPREAADYSMLILDSLGQKLAGALLRAQGVGEMDVTETLREVEKVVEAAHDAVERVIGVQTGALRIFDRHVIRDWFVG